MWNLRNKTNDHGEKERGKPRNRITIDNIILSYTLMINVQKWWKVEKSCG